MQTEYTDKRGRQYQLLIMLDGTRREPVCSGCAFKGLIEACASAPPCSSPEFELRRVWSLVPRTEQELKWDDIARAPKDGSVVLTDWGFASYVDPVLGALPGLVEGFYLCTADGGVIVGAERAKIDPKFWATIKAPKQ